MKEYQLLKAQMLHDWLEKTVSDRITLFLSTSVNNWSYAEELKDFLDQRSKEECIYIMTGQSAPDKHVILYIGKSTDIRKRWDSHLKGFFKGQKTYISWWNLLVKEERFRFPIFLTVIPQSKITLPPIPGFPTTVGSVEYQLIGLASDAYPEYLLNKEGKRR